MERKEYSQRLENQLREWKRVVQDLQDRAQRSSAQAKLELLELVEKLQLKMDVVQQWLEELRHSGSDTWTGLERRIESAVAEMKAAVEQARRKFKG